MAGSIIKAGRVVLQRVPRIPLKAALSFGMAATFAFAGHALAQGATSPSGSIGAQPALTFARVRKLAKVANTPGSIRLMA